LGNLDGSSNVSEKCIPTGNICIDFKKFKAAICICKTPLALVGEMKRHQLKTLWSFLKLFRVRKLIQL
jgi:hypothetical protein